MQNLIFCNKCRHLGENPVFPYNNECYAVKEIKHTQFREYTEWGRPQEKNKNNDCVDFEQGNIINKITNYFKGGQ